MSTCEECGCKIPEGEKLCSSCQSKKNSFKGTSLKILGGVVAMGLSFVSGFIHGKKSKKKD